MQNAFCLYFRKHWMGMFLIFFQILIILIAINWTTRSVSDSSIEKTIISIDKKLDNIDNKIAKLAVSDSIMNQQLQFYPAAVPTNGNISSKYEVRIDPYTKLPTQHYGVDIKAEKGTPVVATATGMVESCDDHAGYYGKRVVIDHFNGYKSIYGHLSKIIAKQGSTIVKGDTLGLVGNTGRSTGNHLHYEITFHDKKVNPAVFRKQYSTQLLNTPTLLYTVL